MIRTEQMINAPAVLQKDKWCTPPELFRLLDKSYSFTLDPCCEKDSALCSTYFTPETNGLAQDWAGHTVYCNPPYSRGNIARWVRKCCEEGSKPHTTVVALLPVSTSADWWCRHVVQSGADITFIERRLRFVGAPSTAPFSSALIKWPGTSRVATLRKP